jgi:translocator protein
MHPKISALLNVLGLALVLVVNALANTLPINGFNTGQVSAFYPNYFVPSGFTFGIWGVIYFLLSGYVVCSVFLVFSSENTSAKQVVRVVSPLFQVTCLLNIAWILAWHYLFLGTSVVIMVVFLVVLVKLFLRIRSQKNKLKPFYRLWIYHPFVVYLAWISVATLANFTALFVGLGWQGEPFAAATWAFVLVLVACVLAVYFVGRLKEPAFGFVLSWALFGIYAGQRAASGLVGAGAAISLCLVFALTITVLVRTRKLRA